MPDMKKVSLKTTFSSPLLVNDDGPFQLLLKPLPLDWINIKNVSIIANII